MGDYFITEHSDNVSGLKITLVFSFMLREGQKILRLVVGKRLVIVESEASIQSHHKVRTVRAMSHSRSYIIGICITCMLGADVLGSL